MRVIVATQTHLMIVLKNLKNKYTRKKQSPIKKSLAKVCIVSNLMGIKSRIDFSIF